MCYFTAAVTFTSVVSCSNSKGGGGDMYTKISVNNELRTKESSTVPITIWIKHATVTHRPAPVSQSVSHACMHALHEATDS